MQGLMGEKYKMFSVKSIDVNHLSIEIQIKI